MKDNVKASQIVVLSEESLPSKIPDIVDSIHQYGYVIIDAWDNSEKPLKVLADHLGHIQRHVRANEDGIVGEKSIAKEWVQHPEEYLGINNEDFNPHTDGSFLNGAILLDGKLYEVNPPKVLLLQMAKRAPEGGSNVFIDVREVLIDLLEQRPDIVKILKEDCMTVCRDNLISRGFPVLKSFNDSSKIKVTFRFDSKVYASENSWKALHVLNEEYFLNPKYQKSVALEEGQILIVDNWRALHGREKFVTTTEVSTNRKLRRVWLGEDSPRCSINIHNSAQKNRCLNDFDYYGFIKSPVPFSKRGHLNCGIALPEYLQEKFESL